MMMKPSVSSLARASRTGQHPRNDESASPTHYELGHAPMHVEVEAVGKADDEGAGHGGVDGEPLHAAGIGPPRSGVASLRLFRDHVYVRALVALAVTLLVSCAAQRAERAPSQTADEAAGRTDEPGPPTAESVAAAPAPRTIRAADLITQISTEHDCDTPRIRFTSIEEGEAWLDVCGTTRVYQEAPDRSWHEQPLETYVPPHPEAARADSAGATSGDGRVQVRGYYRRDGTYVRPHTRSSPH